MTHVQAFLKDEQGITTVEIILILDWNIHPLLWGGYKVYGVRICG